MSNLHNTFPLKICIIDIFENNIFIIEKFLRYFQDIKKICIFTEMYVKM